MAKNRSKLANQIINPEIVEVENQFDELDEKKTDEEIKKETPSIKPFKEVLEENKEKIFPNKDKSTASPSIFTFFTEMFASFINLFQSPKKASASTHLRPVGPSIYPESSDASASPKTFFSKLSSSLSSAINTIKNTVVSVVHAISKFTKNLFGKIGGWFSKASSQANEAQSYYVDVSDVKTLNDEPPIKEPETKHKLTEEVEQAVKEALQSTADAVSKHVPEFKSPHVSRQQVIKEIENLKNELYNNTNEQSQNNDNDNEDEEFFDCSDEGFDECLTHLEKDEIPITKENVATVAKQTGVFSAAHKVESAQQYKESQLQQNAPTQPVIKMT